MKKTFLLFMYFIITISCYAQVGIGTNTPNGSLEVTSGEEAKFGLVLPIVAKFEDVKNTIAGQPVKIGTIVFDEQRNTICYKTTTSWNCTNGYSQTDPVNVDNQATYVKADRASKAFGRSVSISGDGKTLAIGADEEAIDQMSYRGAVYTYIRNGDTWELKQRIQSETVQESNYFGSTVLLSQDGKTLAVTAGQENFDDARYSGAVHMYKYDGNSWNKISLLSASTHHYMQNFGASLAFSSDGKTLAVGASYDKSNSTGINGSQTSTNSEGDYGAVFIFKEEDDSWTQEAYIKPSNTHIKQKFGNSVALSSDGKTLAVGSYYENSRSSGINGDQNDLGNYIKAGAVYIFKHNGITWTQETYIKPSNTHSGQQFGSSVSLSADGKTLAVGSHYENSKSKGINGDQNDLNTFYSETSEYGAVYIFKQTGTIWEQETYIKASNTHRTQRFGNAVALSPDANTLLVAASGDGVYSKNFDGVQDRFEDYSFLSGAVFLFTRNANTWEQQHYIKAPNTGQRDFFGDAIAISSDANIIVIGTPGEDSDGFGINTANLGNNSRASSGAVFIHKLR